MTLYIYGPIDKYNKIVLVLTYRPFREIFIDKLILCIQCQI